MRVSHGDDVGAAMKPGRYSPGNMEAVSGRALPSPCCNEAGPLQPGEREHTEARLIRHAHAAMKPGRYSPENQCGEVDRPGGAGAAMKPGRYSPENDDTRKFPT